MTKLDLVIVGVQKAGTTSLHQYLKSHPDVIGHFMTEFTFFTDSRIYETGFEAAFRKSYHGKKSKRIIAKNVTIIQNEDSLNKLRRHNPDVKIVLILREPVSRAYSSYNMAIKDGWIDDNFEELQEIIYNKDINHIKYRHFIKTGEYDLSLKLILKYFSKENLRIYLFEDLIKFPQLICNDIFKWMDIDKHTISVEIHNKTVKPKSRIVSKLINALRNQNSVMNKVIRMILPYKHYSKIGEMIIGLNRSGKRYEPIKDDIKEVLKDYYKESNQKFFTLINEKELRENLILFSTNNWISEIYN